MSYEYCLICSNKTKQDILLKHHDFHIAKCLKCGLIYQPFSGSSESLQKIYDNIYQGRESIHDSKLRPTLIRFNRIHADTKKITQKPGSLLDVGCGFGAYVKLFSEKGWDTTGIDFSQSGIKYARSLGLNCHLKSVDNYQPNKKYDVILMNHVIEHFRNPLSILNKIKDWINDDGFIYIRCPNIDAKAVRFSRSNFIGHLKPFEHLYYFNLESLESLIRKAGLDVSSHLDTYGFVKDIINYSIRKKLILRSSWLRINYHTLPAKKKTYLLFRDFYEKAMNRLSYLPIGTKDFEIVAIARKK